MTLPTGGSALTTENLHPAPGKHVTPAGSVMYLNISSNSAF
jgi:hypothetical protein